MYKINYTLICLTIFISSSMAEETFVSLKKNKVNVRYDPSFESDIKFVYKKINLPLKKIDKKENFRRIIEPAFPTSPLPEQIPPVRYGP